MLMMRNIVSCRGVSTKKNLSPGKGKPKSMKKLLKIGKIINTTNFIFNDEVKKIINKCLSPVSNRGHLVCELVGYGFFLYPTHFKKMNTKLT